MNPTSSPNTDVFQTSVTQIAKTAQKQKRVVFLFGAILILVLAAVSIYLSRRGEQSRAGREAFFQARTTLEKELDAVKASLAPASTGGKAPVTAPASIAFTRFPVSERLKESVPALEKVGRENPGSVAGFESLMLLGQVHLEHGGTPEEQAKSISYFETAAQIAPRKEDTVAAYQGLAFAQESQGDASASLKAFQKVVQFGKTPFQGDAMKGVARSQEALKDFAGARATYESMINAFPQGEEARFAKMKIADLPTVVAPKESQK